jgi:peptidoglycan hydrolase CwlO-like protein
MAEMVTIFAISLVLACYAGFRYVNTDMNNYAEFMQSNKAVSDQVTSLALEVQAISNKADNARADVDAVQEHLAQVRRNQMFLHNKLAGKKAPGKKPPPIIPPKIEVPAETFKKVKGQIKGLSK